MAFVDVLNKHTVLANINGVSEKDELTSYVEYEFEELLEFSPNSEDVLIDGIETKCIVQLGKDENKDILIRNSDSFNVGAIVEWNSASWLTYYYEKKAIKGYQKGRIERCNASIKFKNEFNTILEQPIIYGDLSKYSMGVNEEKRMTVPDSSKFVYVQNNNDTLKFYRDFRFIIGRRVFKVTDIDEVEIGGILKIKCIEDEKSIFDDFVTGIANNDLEEIVAISNLEMVGDDEINKGYSASYNVTKFDDNDITIPSSFTFTVEVLNSTPVGAYTLAIVDDNNCTITCNEFMDGNYNLYSIKLIATDDSDVLNIIEKVIEFKGLY